MLLRTRFRLYRLAVEGGVDGAPALRIKFQKLCNLQFRQGSAGPFADPDPSPSSFRFIPSVICASSFQTFEKEPLNLELPAPFVPRASLQERPISRDHGGLL